MSESLLPPEQIRLPSSPSPSPTPSSLPGSPPASLKPTPDDFLAIPPLPASFLVPPRNRSPLSRTHARSRSLASPHPMTRAHSSPGLDSRGRYVLPPNISRPESPMERAMRRHSPLRAVEDSRTIGLGSLNISETISEHAELELSQTPLPVPSEYPPSPSLPPPMHNTFPRSSRRPHTAPLHTTFSSVTSNPASNSPSSSHSSPVMLATKFNEPFPGFPTSSTSSMPSTPTSLRSRSPSISSLETIPDIPDAEEEAVEADEIARLKAAADSADADGMRRRSYLENSPSTTARGYGQRTDKRKRWSVCGAERRQDLDLETIWED
ncbi:hypothetical protein BGW36DRAFT_396798 [Talaromyces proteolyticus]|uniref:Basic proline-rich protein n=1 Tax=Talaromyces proteolyticus TaxID=1131652 RepID=A0AAD4Q269_9EURO|nr:uncharacterized protein BGW36DRAFT_396798 [Talaromyces proteolyticus]KAH8699255.1 hypothetical protein BGW36DRAFT_396798 [Talaromyces proteolyticus]